MRELDDLTPEERENLCSYIFVVAVVLIILSLAMLW